jgi:hypothetical protein
MYLFHAHAVALGGTLERPVSQNIAGLATCCLPLSGGTSSASSGKFDNGLVSFDSAQSDLTGSIEVRNGQNFYVTGVSIVMNKLNVRNMFVADQVVLRLASEHNPKPPQSTSTVHGAGLPLDEPSIITTGCHFDKLKIAGHPVTLDMVHDVFHSLPTYADCEKDWTLGENSKLRKTLMGSTLNPAPSENDPQHLQDIYQSFDLQRNSTTLRPNVLCSFVQRVNGINGTEIDTWGPIIKIPQFGTIYLGEVLISAGYRHVAMFRLQLGSPDGAGFSGPSGGSNGSTVPS